ncbi:MAG: DinB family protein [Acidimicrobiia bacterium]
MSDTPAPTAVPGDDKDWTWVLQRPCPDCGFEAATVDPAELGERMRANADQWAGVLDGDEVALRSRPSPQVWSTLEYACHVRDVYELALRRLRLMLTEDGPTFANWDQDETAVAERYDLADPAAVRPALLAAGRALGDAYDAVQPEQWSRAGVRSDGARFTVETFGRYLLHDPVHHLWDIGVEPR